LTVEGNFCLNQDWQRWLFRYNKFPVNASKEKQLKKENHEGFPLNLHLTDIHIKT